MAIHTMDKVIDGVVITCIDITAAKKIEQELLDKIAILKEQLAG
jgi:hypothetical protein